MYHVNVHVLAAQTTPWDDMLAVKAYLDLPILTCTLESPEIFCQLFCYGFRKFFTVPYLGLRKAHIFKASLHMPFQR